MNITYYLGAGASANCLPVIDEMPGRMQQFIARLRTASSENTHPNFRYLSGALKNPAESLINDSEFILKEMRSHKTIDTLAKKYYLIEQRHSDLIRLKKVLICYFIYEQLLSEGSIRDGQSKETPDKRYDSFIAGIINRKIGDRRLPGNFKIISWNYDIQFELAYQEYRPEETIDQIQKRLQCVPSTSFYKDTSSIDLLSFALVRLNGIAGLTYFNSDAMRELHLAAIEQTETAVAIILRSIVGYYEKAAEDELRSFNYSWEDPAEFTHSFPYSDKVKGLAKSIMKNTDILVVAGYSFPLFNRGVDKELIESLPAGANVYIQDRPERTGFLKNLFGSSFSGLSGYTTKSGIHAVTYTDQFFIPPEIDL